MICCLLQTDDIEKPNESDTKASTEDSETKEGDESTKTDIDLTEKPTDNHKENEIKEIKIATPTKKAKVCIMILHQYTASKTIMQRYFKHYEKHYESG